MTVTPFPIFNLGNIPEALRKLANDIERDPGLCERVVVCMGSDLTGPSYRAFGPDPFTRAQALGLCFQVALDIGGAA